MPTIYEDKANALIGNMRQLFVSIEAKDYFFETKKPDPNKPNYTDIVKAFEEISFAVQDDILAHDNSKKRTQALEKWINKMQECWDNGDHNSAHAIYKALKSTPIQGLTDNWKNVSSQAKKQLDDKKFLGNRTNQEYEEEMKKEQAQKHLVPSIPFFVATLRGNVDKLKEAKMVEDLNIEAKKAEELNSPEVKTNSEETSKIKSDSSVAKTNEALIILEHHQQAIKRQIGPNKKSNLASAEQKTPHIKYQFIDAVEKNNATQNNTIATIINLLDAMDLPSQAAFYEEFMGERGKRIAAAYEAIVALQLQQQQYQAALEKELKKYYKTPDLIAENETESQNSRIAKLKAKIADNENAILELNSGIAVLKTLIKNQPNKNIYNFDNPDELRHLVFSMAQVGLEQAVEKSTAINHLLAEIKKESQESNGQKNVVDSLYAAVNSMDIQSKIAFYSSLGKAGLEVAHKYQELVELRIQLQKFKMVKSQAMIEEIEQKIEKTKNELPQLENLTKKNPPISMLEKDDSAWFKVLNAVPQLGLNIALEQRKKEISLFDTFKIELSKGGEAKDNAINSLFRLVDTMDAKSQIAFYTALGTPESIKIAGAYREIISTELELQKYKGNKLQQYQNKDIIKKLEQNLKTLKEQTIKTAKARLRNDLTNVNAVENDTWLKAINAIPPDKFGNTYFDKPIIRVDSNNPRHEELRQKMPRDMRNYRYIAPKGADGAQEAGPQGGWYDAPCYQTPDGRIHPQRVLIKRETNYSKNIIESLSGRLKAALVNEDRDYVANTYLVHDSSKDATGENTYAVSIAFNEFSEGYKLAGLDSRIRMQETRAALGDKDAKNLSENLVKEIKRGTPGFDEGLIANWFVKGFDFHSGNWGLNSKAFVNIDHAGDMVNLTAKVNPNRYGFLHNLGQVLRREPTHHAHEYPLELRVNERMAASISHYTSRMTASELTTLINDEIDQAVIQYEKDPVSLIQFAERIGVPGVSLSTAEKMGTKKPGAARVKQVVDATKNFLSEIMYARLLNLRQYGKEMELSFCFEYSEQQQKLVPNEKKLMKFIRDNPNFSLAESHHFRGEANQKSLTTLYHIFHNRFGVGPSKDLEKTLRDYRSLVMNNVVKDGISHLMEHDFALKNDLVQRAQNTLSRLRIIQQIFADEKRIDNPYATKINDMIEYLTRYSGEMFESRRQHLTQLCDEAYTTINSAYHYLDAKPLKEPSIFLMAPMQYDGKDFHMPSNDNQLYLYKDKNDKIFYVDENEKTVYLNENDSAALLQKITDNKLEFDQIIDADAHLIKCINTEVINEVLNITSKEAVGAAAAKAKMVDIFTKLHSEPDLMNEYNAIGPYNNAAFKDKLIADLSADVAESGVSLTAQQEDDQSYDDEIEAAPLPEAIPRPDRDPYVFDEEKKPAVALEEVAPVVVPQPDPAHAPAPDPAHAPAPDPAAVAPAVVTPAPAQPAPAPAVVVPAAVVPGPAPVTLAGGAPAGVTPPGVAPAGVAPPGNAPAGNAPAGSASASSASAGSAPAGSGAPASGAPAAPAQPAPVQPEVLKDYNKPARQVLESKPTKTYMEQAAEVFHQSQSSPESVGVHAVDMTARASGPPSEKAQAFTIENPANKNTGALILERGNQIKMIDFENPDISFANVLAQQLFHSIPQKPGVSQETLRNFIQKNYINDIQSRSETVNPKNMVDLFKMLKKEYGMQVPGSSLNLFKEQAFAKQVCNDFHKNIDWHPQLISWAHIWVKEFEDKGIDPKDIRVENKRGNPEFARMLVIILVAKGANPRLVNRTGYQFDITQEDVNKMQRILGAPETKQEVELHNRVVGVSADFLPEHLKSLPKLLNAIEERLNHPINGLDKKELEEMKKNYTENIKQLGEIGKSIAKTHVENTYLQKEIKRMGELQEKVQLHLNDIERRLSSHVSMGMHH